MSTATDYTFDELQIAEKAWNERESHYQKQLFIRKHIAEQRARKTGFGKCQWCSNIGYFKDVDGMICGKCSGSY